MIECILQNIRKERKLANNDNASVFPTTFNYKLLWIIRKCLLMNRRSKGTLKGA